MINAPDQDDADVLEWLLQRGHPRNRILFVRNKFDELLESAKKNRKLSNTADLNSVTEEIKKDIKREFGEELEGIFPDPDTRPELSFTSSERIARRHGIGSYIETLPELLETCIGSSSPGKLEIYNRFKSKKTTLQSKLAIAKEYFRDIFRTEQDITERMIARVPWLLPASHTYDHPESRAAISPEEVKQLKSEFKDRFHFHLNEKIDPLRYMATWDQTEAQMIETHADQLSQKKHDDREDYLETLQNKVHCFREKSDQKDLQEALDFSAYYKAEQYVTEFSDSLLKSMKKQMWWFQRVATSDKELIEALKNQLSRAIDAELLIARYKRMMEESLLISEASSQPLLSGQTQTFQQQQADRVGKLADQLNSLLIKKYVAPRLYTMVVTESSAGKRIRKINTRAKSITCYGSVANSALRNES